MTQIWKAYTKAQTQEIEKFDYLLKDLIQNYGGIEDTLQKRGRPSLKKKELLFCAIKKVYSQVSSRRAHSIHRKSNEEGFIIKAPHYNAINKFLNNPEVTVWLQRLITNSALPLKAVESQFAIDSSGFTTSSFTSYLVDKHGDPKKHKYMKAHICCGVKTNIITSAIVTDSYSNDTVHLKSLVKRTSDNFDALEYSADKAYSSRSNAQFIFDNGATPFILFRKSAKGRGLGASAWRNSFHYFRLHEKEFLQHYHARSNVESTFAMVKRKLGDRIKSKNPKAQENELLCKLLCHNIIVLITEMHELGIETKF